MKLSAKLALRHMKNSPKHTAWTIFGIVLAVGMLVAIGGFGSTGATTLEAVIDGIDGLTGDVSAVSFSLAAFLGIFTAIAGAVVISNTFRVSALERTRQFGILKSVGATRKQIRATVMWEGIFLLLIGVPLGILAGFVIHFFALFIMNAMVDISEISENIRFSFEVRPEILAIAVALSVAVILVSAWLPARKAAKTPAIDAIRGANEFKRRAKVKHARFIQKIFGFEGALAAKQLKRSRRHFRATIVSVSVSVVLILASVSLSTHMGRSVEARIIQMGAPTASFAVIAPEGYSTVGMDVATLTQITREVREFPDTTVVTIGAYPYNSAEHGWTLVVVQSDDDYAELLRLAGAPHGSNLLINVHLQADAHGNLSQYNPHDISKGEILRLYRQTIGAGDGNISPGFAWNDEPEYFEIHGIVNELPAHLFHLTEAVGLFIVVPDGYIRAIQWMANTPDPEGFNAFAYEIFHRNYTMLYGEQFLELDMGEAFTVLRILIDSALAYVRIFSIMLIFLGLTNVISTIATGVKLRSREFAILTSVGMERRGLRKMLALESLLGSVRALTFGLPVGFGAAYLMYTVGENSNPIGIVFSPPWAAMAVCAAGVVAITFVIMQVSAVTVGRSSVVEAIRGTE